jgi:hypothetical protein
MFGRGHAKSVHSFHHNWVLSCPILKILGSDLKWCLDWIVVRLDSLDEEMLKSNYQHKPWLWRNSICLFLVPWIYQTIRNLQFTPCSFRWISRISSHPAVFFSHNKPANSTFSHTKPAKRTGCQFLIEGCRWGALCTNVRAWRQPWDMSSQHCLGSVPIWSGWFGLVYFLDIIGLTSIHVC